MTSDDHESDLPQLILSVLTYSFFNLFSFAAIYQINLTHLLELCFQYKFAELSLERSPPPLLLPTTLKLSAYYLKQFDFVSLYQLALNVLMHEICMYCHVLISLLLINLKPCI